VHTAVRKGELKVKTGSKLVTFETAYEIRKETIKQALRNENLRDNASQLTSTFLRSPLCATRGTPEQVSSEIK
jgi:hypothetical protein